MALRSLFIASAWACLFATTISADDLEIETVLTGLNRPSSIAIRPGGADDNYEIFIAEPGAGRIVKYISGQVETQPAITGFDSDGKKENADGPQSLVFLDRIRLVVVTSGDDRDALVRSYELRDEEAITADSTKEQVGVAAQDGIRRGTDALRLHAAARTISNDRVPDLLIVTATGDAERRSLWKLPVRAGTIGELVPFTTETDGDASSKPAAITVSEQGFVVVAGSAGANDPSSEIVFYNPIDGAPLLRLPCDLPSIMALAYSPRTGNLYAAAAQVSQADDLSSVSQADDLSSGISTAGVYRIDDASKPGAPASRATKVADVNGPTAIAFAPDGSLYVSANKKNDTSKNGVLLKITGDF